MTRIKGGHTTEAMEAITGVNSGSRRTIGASADVKRRALAMIESVANGDRIEIRGFGTFQPRARATKIGYNPCTGQPMPLPASTTILFKPSRELTKKMNG